MSRLLALTVAHLLMASTLGAQSDDSVYAGRQCDNRLKALRMPLLAELGDSARFDSLLSHAADPQAQITQVALRFRKDGSLREVDVRSAHARSSAARVELRDGMRAAVMATVTNPRDFLVLIVRLNATGQIRLLASTATCAPEVVMTPQATSLILRERQRPREHGDAVVEFILEADGRIRHAWLERSTGFAEGDSLAMELFRAMRFDPAIVGATPAATLVQQPFTF